LTLPSRARESALLGLGWMARVLYNSCPRMTSAPRLWYSMNESSPLED